MELGGKMQHDGHFFDYHYPSGNMGFMVNVNVLSSKKSVYHFHRVRGEGRSTGWCIKNSVASLD